ncbi:MAG: DUF2892 domain-containing protein [Cytophagaceae bacterium]
MFGRNVCGRERTLRFLLGVLLIVLGIFYNSWIIGLLGWLPIATAVFSYCPVNSLFGRNSCAWIDRRPSL